MHLFTRDPWTVYACIVTALMLVYYAFIVWKFYRKQISSLLAGRTTKRRFHSRIPTQQIQEPVTVQQQTAMTEAQPEAWRSQEASNSVEELFEHLGIEIQEAHQKGYGKQDLIQMLQMILTDYAHLNSSAFRYAVTNRIDAECAKYGSIHLSEGDKGEVWRMV